jgi:hypothetical protein
MAPLRKIAVVAAFFWSGFAPGAAHAQTATPPLLSDYAVLGMSGVTIRPESRVVSGAVGTVSGTVRLARSARVTNQVAGPTVRLTPQARTGRLFCHLVSGPPPLPSCNGFADPLVDPALLPPPAAVPGTTDLRIPAHTGTAPLPPGSFRIIRVGTGSVLQLAGGEYAAKSLQIGRGARVTCTTTCHIAVLAPVRVKQGAELGAASAVQASTVRVDIAASVPRPVFRASMRANVSATIYAPTGDIVLGPLGSYRGAFVGRTVAVGPRATVRGDSAL